jgi:hypothetical protein
MESLPSDTLFVMDDIKTCVFGAYITDNVGTLLEDVLEFQTELAHFFFVSYNRIEWKGCSEDPQTYAFMDLFAGENTQETFSANYWVDLCEEYLVKFS